MEKHFNIHYPNQLTDFRIWDDTPIKDGFKGVMINKEYAMKSAYLHDALLGKYPIMFAIGIYDKNQKMVFNGDFIEITWPSGEITGEYISYDTNFGYYRYGNNAICELMEDERISFEVIGNIFKLK